MRVPALALRALPLAVLIGTALQVRMPVARGESCSVVDANPCPDDGGPSACRGGFCCSVALFSSLPNEGKDACTACDDTGACTTCKPPYTLDTTPGDTRTTCLGELGAVCEGFDFQCANDGLCRGNTCCPADTPEECASCDLMGCSACKGDGAIHDHNCVVDDGKACDPHASGANPPCRPGRACVGPALPDEFTRVPAFAAAIGTGTTCLKAPGVECAASSECASGLCPAGGGSSSSFCCDAATWRDGCAMCDVRGTCVALISSASTSTTTSTVTQDTTVTENFGDDWRQSFAVAAYVITLLVLLACAALCAYTMRNRRLMNSFVPAPRAGSGAGGGKAAAASPATTVHNPVAVASAGHPAAV